MSNDTVEQMTDEQELGEQVDAGQLAEAGASNSEDTTQVETETEQAEVEQVDLSTLAGTQPETTEKEHNNIYAANRIKAKKLKELEAQIAEGNIPQEHAFKAEEQAEKPRLTDFVSEDVLYEKYNGSEAVALAAYQEAKEEWDAYGSSIEAKKAAHNEQLSNSLQAQIASEEAFDASVDKFRKTVKGLDDSLASAEKLLGEADFNAIRDLVGDNAALVLAVIGSNKAEQEALKSAAAGGANSVVRHLTRLEDKITQNLPSVNKISKANSETPLGGGGSDSTGNLQAKIDKAASSGDVEEYQRLKAIQKAS